MQRKPRPAVMTQAKRNRAAAEDARTIVHELSAGPSVPRHPDLPRGWRIPSKRPRIRPIAVPAGPLPPIG